MQVEAPSVEKPLTLTMEDIKSLPLDERRAVLEELEKKSGLVRLAEDGGA